MRGLSKLTLVHSRARGTKLVNGNLTDWPHRAEDMEALPETLQKRRKAGGKVMSDPVLLWTLFAIGAANILVVAIALVNAHRQ